jgi:tetratricopeptide (TPR) repeat protein
MAEARLTIGNIEKSLGQFDNAARSYTEALHLKPTLAEAAFNLGNLWRDCGRYPQAVAAYDRSLAIDPSV